MYFEYFSFCWFFSPFFYLIFFSIFFLLFPNFILQFFVVEIAQWIFVNIKFLHKQVVLYIQDLSGCEHYYITTSLHLH